MQLAIVAAEDAVADQRAQLRGNGGLVFDGQIRDAAPGVQLLRPDDGACGADGHAGLAVSAQVRFGGAGAGQLQIGVDFAEKEPAARLRVDQQRVLAHPAQPGLLRQGLLQHRGAVREGPKAGVHALRRLIDAPGQPGQPAAHQLVVILSQGVAGNIGPAAIGQRRLAVRALRQIVHAGANQAAGAGLQLRRMQPLLHIAGHIAHFAVEAPRQPATQMGGLIAQLQIGNADLLKAQFPRPAPDVPHQRFGGFRCHCRKPPIAGRAAPFGAGRPLAKRASQTWAAV